MPLRYLPLELGYSWTYRVTKAAKISTKVQVVAGIVRDYRTPAGDLRTVFRLVTTKDLGLVKGGGITVSWQAWEGDRLHRYAEDSFTPTNAIEEKETWTPAKLRLDASPQRLVPGRVWTETYAERHEDALTTVVTTKTRTESWQVVAVDEEVTVPAGTFRCLHVRSASERTDPGTQGTAAEKHYWFARGVGKIKESGAQTEELSSYRLVVSNEE